MKKTVEISLRDYKKLIKDHKRLNAIDADPRLLFKSHNYICHPYGKTIREAIDYAQKIKG